MFVPKMTVGALAVVGWAVAAAVVIIHIKRAPQITVPEPVMQRMLEHAWMAGVEQETQRRERGLSAELVFPAGLWINISAPGASDQERRAFSRLISLLKRSR